MWLADDFAGIVGDKTTMAESSRASSGDLLPESRTRAPVANEDTT